MKKPVKIVLWALGGLIALVLLLVIALPLWIGPVVTTAANSIVPGYTGTDFKMESFSLNPYSGKIRVGAVTLFNPKGYDEPSAFSIRSISVDLDTGSLLTKKVHIADITIEEPFVSYVYDGEGSNNFERILAAVKAKQGPATEEEASKEEAESKEAGEGKKLVIDRFAVNGTSVKYRKLKLSIAIPTLKNIGGDNPEGASFEDIVEAISKSVRDSMANMGGALGNVATDILKSAGGVADGAVKDMTKAATDGAQAVVGGATGAVKDASKAVGDGAKAVVDGAAGAVKDAGKAATDGAKDALKKVGNLFGK
ncbi:MAG: AsmA family protein [Kiritimatiellia bacterium]